MEDALFDMDETKPPLRKTDTPPANNTISDAEIERVRETFLKAGITVQTERKTIIEKSVGREVSSLRDLSSHEVPRLIYTLNDIIVANRKPDSPNQSAWDDREEDTWIDKL